MIDDDKLVTNDDTLSGFPVIIMDSTTYDYDTPIKAYLRILTNTTYLFNGSDNSDKYAISVLNCNIDGRTPVASNTLTFTNSSFGMNSTTFDSNVSGQFSLIDVQFYDPSDTSNSKKTAYHLYVPVITKKLYYYGFKTTVFSGTQYYESKYTGETGTNSFNGTEPKVLMENYGTPVIQYLRWLYPTETLVSDIVGGGFGLNWHYKKAIDITVSYGNKIPVGSKLVLIDKNNQNKEYYYTVTGNELYDGKTTTLDFDKFKDLSNTSPVIANFQTLIDRMTFTATTYTDSQTRGAFVEDSTNGTLTVKMNDGDASKTVKIRLAEAGDRDEDTFDLSELCEDYYLTIYSKEASGVLYAEDLIDISSYLTSGGAGVAPTIVIDSCFTINYSHSGVIVQFPEREQGDNESNIGTYVSASSSLAYSPDDTTYSSNTSDVEVDTVGRLYYRYAMSDADLKFNVYQSDSSDAAQEVDGDAITKANDQLGINIFDGNL